MCRKVRKGKLSANVDRKFALIVDKNGMEILNAIMYSMQNLKCGLLRLMLATAPDAKLEFKKFLAVITWLADNADINGAGFVGKNTIVIILIQLMFLDVQASKV